MAVSYTHLDVYKRQAKHKDWAMDIAAKNTLTAENCMDILQQEVGKVFAAILEQCGVCLLYTSRCV